MSKESGFQLQGNAATLYENSWVPAQMGQCAVELADVAGISVGDNVLDVGCGSGVVAREASRRVGASGSVTGVDINEPMLEVARLIAADQGLNGIDWQQCDASALHFRDDDFDVVLCQQGLQFMPEKENSVREMARVLAPGGRLAVSVWKSQSPFGAALGKVLERHLGDGTTASWQAIYSLGDREVLRALATDVGLRDAYVHFDFKFVRHAEPQTFIANAIAGSPLAAEVDKLSNETLRAIVQEILEELIDHMDDGGLAIPAGCHTLIAIKAE